MTADPQNERPRKERLRRLNRVYARSPIYFVTACAFARKNILARREVQQAFRAFADNDETHGAYLGAYVLMPDHLHLFVACRSERSVHG